MELIVANLFFFFVFYSVSSSNPIDSCENHVSIQDITIENNIHNYVQWLEIVFLSFCIYDTIHLIASSFAVSRKFF